MDENELVERARRGDREAFRELVERHQDDVFYLALGLLRNRDDAEDVVQDVFIRAGARRPRPGAAAGAPASSLSRRRGSRRRLEGRRHRRGAALVSDLEVVFLQLANLPASEYVRGVDMVRATIDDRALLFQLSVEEMRRLAGPQA